MKTDALVGYEVEGYFRAQTGNDGCPVEVDWHTDGSLMETKRVEGKRLYGRELVTRPKPAVEAMADLKRIFSWMVRIKACTDSRCGLHINVGIPGQFPSATKVLAASRSLEVARLFGRQKNTWCSVEDTQARNKIIGALSDYARSVIFPDMAKTAKFLETTEPSAVGRAFISAALDEMDEWLSVQSKGFAVVRRGSSQGPYFEFRTPGGSDYHRRFKDVVWATKVFIEAVEGACA